MKKSIYMLLGADRVGKSTTVLSLKKHFYTHNKYYSEPIIKDFHFSGPEPYHNSPIDQYLIPIVANLDHYRNENCIFICDRGGSEVCFYENYRRGVDIPSKHARRFEQFLLDNFSEIKTYLIYVPWEDIIERHEKEILDHYPQSTTYYKNLLLSQRENEHKAYYEYMFYESQNSLLNIEYIFDPRQIVSQLESLIAAERFYEN